MSWLSGPAGDGGLQGRRLRRGAARAGGLAALQRGPLADLEQQLQREAARDLGRAGARTEIPEKPSFPRASSPLGHQMILNLAMPPSLVTRLCRRMQGLSCMRIYSTVQYSLQQVSAKRSMPAIIVLLFISVDEHSRRAAAVLSIS